jgi:para-aminobenzoate synthetase component 1
VRRGKTEEEDARLVDELLASKKDDAELSMIVDLERNDLGKVCAPGTVKVEAHREIQKLSHVIHTYSRVSGKLAARKDVFDVIEAVFPGGSITGCPKKRTMEIIDALEDYKRGIYTGSAGFISFSGDMDLNILIRTMLFNKEKVYFQVGGGIVIDSDPKSEYVETLNKAEGMRLALMQ